MSLGENLQYLRKQKDITQEQLAEQLEVSRQSVSKWESGASYPEMEKLLQISSMFHCSMDTLLQGDVSKEFAEDSSGYDRVYNQFSRWVTGGVGLIIAGTGVAALLEGAGIDEGMCGAFFFALLIVAVMILVVNGMQYDHFVERNPHLEDFYTEEEKERAYRRYTVRIAAGIGIILLAVLFVLVADESLGRLLAGTAMAEKADDLLGGGFLLAVAAGVSFLVYGGMQKSKYNIDEYNKEARPSPEQKKRKALVGKVCACIMLVATMAYMLLGFLWDLWIRAWVAFAVGGILCGIAAVALSRDGEE